MKSSGPVPFGVLLLLEAGKSDFDLLSSDWPVLTVPISTWKSCLGYVFSKPKGNTGTSGLLVQHDSLYCITLFYYIFHSNH